VLSVIDTMKHPYFKARDMVRKVRDPILGEVTIPGFPLKFSAYPDLPDIQAPLLGEHGAQVLKEVLDYSEARIAQLKEGGILFSENR
jgi:CoA:oxalate CoA-transferase